MMKKTEDEIEKDSLKKFLEMIDSCEGDLDFLKWKINKRLKELE